MLYTRRDLGKIALATLPMASVTRSMAAAKPNSVFGGVQIGAITYSFRSLGSSAEEMLKYCVDCNISGVELMSNVAESYAGAPAQPRGFPGGMAQGGPGGAPPAGGPPPGAGGPPQAGGAGGQGDPPRQRPQLTPEQQEERRKRAEEMKSWRLSVSMDKYRAFRKMYEDAGVKIYAFKLPPTLEMSEEEYAYIWNVADALGSNHVTMELPTDDALLKRVAEYAAKRKLPIAFHTHGQGGSSGFEKVLNASPYTALNFDVGHYYGVNGESPVPLMVKYAGRTASLHLKDRKGPSTSDPAGRPGGPNMPWGQGETPLVDVLQTMKKNKFRFPASIEYEYQTPAGSDVLTEMKKCVEYCRKALA